jgi:prevent-host-death family protein
MQAFRRDCAKVKVRSGTLATLPRTPHIVTSFLVRRPNVKTVNLAEAKAKLSALGEEAGAGETVCITKHGRPVARLVPVEPPKIPLDIEKLRAHLKTMPMQEEDAGTFMRRMRDEARY